MSTETSTALAARLSEAGCVFAEEEAALLMSEAGTMPAPGYADRLEEMVQRRIAGHPLEQILGWAEFCGLRVPVAPGVFVPRRRTELLATHAVQLLAAMTDSTAGAGQLAKTASTVVELCCGSGAVTLAIAAQTAASPTLFAVDFQPEAVERARLSLDGVATVLAGDLFSPLPGELPGRVDMVVANAPYIPTAQLPTLPHEARDYEPMLTLDGGSDGLDVLRRIISAAPPWLRPGGYLLLECSRQQAQTVRHILTLHGFTPEIVRRKATDATIAVGRRELAAADAPGRAASLGTAESLGTGESLGTVEPLGTAASPE
ncbi:putative protein N(5)-glutamine methyltransferase [Arthrobacter citreus]|uniref:putative protein N(5)-glutamine methyltransferase n=1 Tax=Arthrobacter TaxID=1663 RepID=UPI001FE2D98D|nr:putative protein N(5)-glutamine methyltransferase [Arthrobacter gandavensis]